MSLPVTNRTPNGSNEFFKDQSIKNLIQGSFLKLGVLTSDISFSKVCTGETNIQFLYYPIPPKAPHTHFVGRGASEGASESPPQREGQIGPSANEVNLKNKILPLLNILNLILKLREPTKNYKFVCVKAANKFVDSKILNDYIYYMVLEDPSRLKNVVNSLLKEYKLLAHNGA